MRRSCDGVMFLSIFVKDDISSSHRMCVLFCWKGCLRRLSFRLSPTPSLLPSRLWGGPVKGLSLSHTPFPAASPLYPLFPSFLALPPSLALPPYQGMEIRHAQRQPAHQKDEAFVDDLDNPPPHFIGGGLADHDVCQRLPRCGPHKGPNEPKEKAKREGILDKEVLDTRPGGQVEACAWFGW